jgi:hypothetical protein
VYAAQRGPHTVNLMEYFVVYCFLLIRQVNIILDYITGISVELSVYLVVNYFPQRVN